MNATEKVVAELLAKGVPMDVIEEGIRLAAKQVAADIVAGTGAFGKEPREHWDFSKDPAAKPDDGLWSDHPETGASYD